MRDKYQLPRPVEILADKTGISCKEHPENVKEINKCTCLVKGVCHDIHWHTGYETGARYATGMSVEFLDGTVVGISFFASWKFISWEDFWISWVDMPHD